MIFILIKNTDWSGCGKCCFHVKRKCTKPKSIQACDAGRIYKKKKSK